jgi:hypothetical protein
LTGGAGVNKQLPRSRAQMAELVDALVSGTSAHKAWRFESSSGHHLFFRRRSPVTAEINNSQKIKDFSSASVRGRSGPATEILGIFLGLEGSQKPFWV